MVSDYASYVRATYVDAIRTIANDLRDLANRVERLAPGDQMTADDATRAAEGIQHALAWGVANLSAERLTRYAGDLHGAEDEL